MTTTARTSKKRSTGRKSSSTASKKRTATRSKSAATSKSSHKSTGRRKSSSSSRYGSLAGKKVEKAVSEMKEGALRSGGSGKKVTSRKQAIAIGLSEARKAGGKVPPPKKSS
jgi:hypothetical protein